jgi:hypothetical protein
VVVNLGIYVKAVRGIFSAAYSLLSDCTIYPVINGSAFYLDDLGELIFRIFDNWDQDDRSLEIPDVFHIR